MHEVAIVEVAPGEPPAIRPEEHQAQRGSLAARILLMDDFCIACAQGTLAQYGLSRTEVERWLTENAGHAGMHAGMHAGQSGCFTVDLMPDMQSGSFGTPRTQGSSSDEGRVGASDQAAFRTRNPQVWPISALAAEALAGSNHSQQGRDDRHREHSARWYRSQQKMHTFEEQVRYVAQQAAALRTESQQLRSEEHIDQGRLDALLALLDRAAIGEHGLEPQQRLQPGMALQPPLLQPPLQPHLQSQLQPQVINGGHLATFSNSNEHLRPLRAAAPQFHVAPPSNMATSATWPINGSVPYSATHEAQHHVLDHPTHARARNNRRRNHRQDQLSILQRWFNDHVDDPYPNPDEKAALARKVGMEVRQIEHCARSQLEPHGPREGHV